MARVSKKKVVAGYLGYSPEALRVDHLTQTLRKRSGVHHYNGVEVASVFDLVELSRA